MRTTLAAFGIAILLGAANYLLSVWPRIRAKDEFLDEIRLPRSRWDHEPTDEPNAREQAQTRRGRRPA